MSRSIDVRIRNAELAVTLTLVLVALVATSNADASTYCPPNGPGAPTYCENIPHKDKQEPGKLDPSKIKDRFQQDDAHKESKDAPAQDKK